MFLKITFVSCFSIAGVDANNLPIVKFTLRSKILFVIVLAPTNSFKTLTTWRCYFFSKLFFAIVIFASSITVVGTVEEVIVGEVGTGFFLTGSHLPNQTFLRVAYSIFFSMRQQNICFTSFLPSSLASFPWFIQMARTPILSINMSKDIYFTS